MHSVQLAGHDICLVARGGGGEGGKGVLKVLLVCYIIAINPESRFDLQFIYQAATAVHCTCSADGELGSAWWPQLACVLYMGSFNSRLASVTVAITCCVCHTGLS